MNPEAPSPLTPATQRQSFLLRLCTLAALSFLCLAASAQHTVTPPCPLRLPLKTVFHGQEKFHKIIQQAEAESWRSRPIGQRAILAARALCGTPYLNYTLEVDDNIENPVVNLNAMDCWTFYENSLALARMLAYKPAPYRPEDLLHMVELERYRKGTCTGSYLSRMHHLEEVFYDNHQRKFSQLITPRIPGAERLKRDIREMTAQWKSYRYLRNNPALLEPMGKIEKYVSSLPVYQIPKNHVRNAERYLADGDICAITTTSTAQYTSHVGLIVRINGRAHFMHATSTRSKGRCCIIDQPITTYLQESSKHSGIAVSRPNDLPKSRFWPAKK